MMIEWIKNKMIDKGEQQKQVTALWQQAVETE